MAQQSTRGAQAGSSGPSLSRLTPQAGGTQPKGYRGWEDVYRQHWTWDKVVKVSHLRTNCISACSFDAYVKDGIVWREEQNATYAQTSPDVPDFNPRGCPMGCIYSQMMYDPIRVKYPLKRVGPRGSGQWQRISWDQALTEIADKLIDTIIEDGPECIVYDTGTTNVDFGIGSMLEGHVLSQGLGASSIDSYAGVGDLPNGLIQTWGLYMSEGTSDDWFNADFIIIWIGNPNYTHVPEAHYIYEAQYNGATLVTIAPDYSPSTIHADYWLNPNYATDAALALAMCQVLVEEKLYQEDYIKEQTDLPFLVRQDTKRFLRQSDLQQDGQDDIFYFWDTKTNAIAEAPGTWGHPEYTLRLGDLNPALEGTYQVTLADGQKVTVQPLFELFKEHLKDYTPEKAQAITGVGPQAVREVAREMAKARSAMIYVSWGACKHHHSDLFQRGMCYLLALTGNSGGKPGAGAKVSTWWPAPSVTLTAGLPGAAQATTPSVGLQTTPPPALPEERVVKVRDFEKMATAATYRSPVSPLIPWLYAHDPKWREQASRNEYNDPALKRPVDEYMQEIFSNNWQPIWPKPPKKPRVYYFSGPNPLRRWPMNHIIRQSLWQEIDTIITCDFRMSSSGMWADYILPACGYYEKPGIKYTQSYIPYVIVGDRAVEPLYESKHEWDIAFLLAKKIQERARARGVSTFTDAFGNERDLSIIYDQMTANGFYQEGPEGEEKALDFIMKYSVITRASGLGEAAWAEAAQQGAVRIKAIPPTGLLAMMGAVYSDFTDEKPLHQCDWFIVHKEPWPTLTGRQQFYIDHPWFMELGEAFVTHKGPLPAGGHYPIRLSGGHDRWSIHAIWSADKWLMRLQRGEPVVYLSVADAQARGIQDHDVIRVRNEVGSFLARAKVSPSMRPGQASIYHSREPYQFQGWFNQNAPTATPMKVHNMVGGYGQLHYRRSFYSMNHTPKEAAVEIEKA